MADATRPMTAAQKILARASNRPFVAIGEVIHPDPELVIVHDGYVETACAELGAVGYRRVCHPERVMFVTDHEVSYGSQRAVERGRNIRRIAKEWQVGHFFDVGRGGHGHIYPMEAGYVRPGMFLFAYDMHCTNFGAIGALAIGAGAEITTVLATGTLWTEVPSSLLIDLQGSLPPGVHPRDVGFLLSKGFTGGEWDIDADNRVIEFAGQGIAGFDLASRVALCNTLTEIGVANVLFAAPPPGMDRAAAAGFLSDSAADYAGRVTFDLAGLKPQVALPGAPDRAVDIDTVVGTPIDHAFIGACGSSMYEDFVAAARVMRGQRVADRVRLFVGPGTNKIAERLANEGLLQEFMEAGATILPPGCGPCAGGAMAPLGSKEVSISTAATNHAGRFGAKDGEVYLGSPLTVAASAIAGRLSDPRRVIADRGAEMTTPLKKRGICHVFGDRVPLDDGVMAFKFAIERVTDAKLLIPHLFEQLDPSFAARVKPGDLVVAGKDFGFGKPHTQGFIAMAALNMALLCESMPHKSLRRAVAIGLPVLTGCAGCAGFVKSGDELEVDFETGAACNLTTGAATQFAPMPPILRDIVVNGGSAGSMRAFLAAHPELAAAPQVSAA